MDYTDYTRLESGWCSRLRAWWPLRVMRVQVPPAAPCNHLRARHFRRVRPRRRMRSLALPLLAPRSTLRLLSLPRHPVHGSCRALRRSAPPLPTECSSACEAGREHGGSTLRQRGEAAMSALRCLPRRDGRTAVSGRAPGEEIDPPVRPRARTGMAIATTRQRDQVAVAVEMPRHEAVAEEGLGELRRGPCWVFRREARAAGSQSP